MDHIDIYTNFNREIASLPLRALENIHKGIALESKRQKVFMNIDEGGIKYIDIKMRPWFITKTQARFLHKICLQMRLALARLFPLYFSNKEVRQILPLNEDEKEWFNLFNKKNILANQTVLERLDSNVTFQNKSWAEFKFIESNSVGVGGVHYVPVINKIINKVVIKTIKRNFKNLRVSPTNDFRDILLGMMKKHAISIGRGRLNLALVEVLYDTEGGTDEFEGLKEYFGHKGIKAFICDPRDLCLKKGEIYFKNNQIDIMYRDSEIYELIDIEKKGKSVRAIKEAFLNNQVISSASGELDHKSTFEILTREDLLKHFTPAQRKLFKEHVVWTRLIFERNTSSPIGERIDLIYFMKKNKDNLVIKPNRAYGGKNVSMGLFTRQNSWETLIDKCVKQPSEYVVQELAEIKSESFPVFDGNNLDFKDSYVITGCAATDTGIAFLGRASVEPVVNVSRGGALIATLLLDS